MNIMAYGMTDSGLLRPNNEDSFAICDELNLYMVADGMGGHAAGEIASKMAVDIVKDHIKRTHLDQDPFMGGYDATFSKAANRLGSAFKLANQVINQAAAQNPPWQGMGTTIAALWHPNPPNTKVVIAHIGDSRVYLLRNNAIQRMTQDHSIVEEQIKRGLISRQEARQSKVKNVITRALGHSPQVVVDLTEISLRPLDRILLCTDGLTNMVSDQYLNEIVCANENPEKACQELIAAANANGGTDNITVALAYYF